MKITIIGGAGFIGSNLTKALIGGGSSEVVVFDNFSSGKMWHLASVRENTRLQIVAADIYDTEALKKAISGSDVVYHLASNPDIARSAKEPAIDFVQGTALTHRVIEAVREEGVKLMIYASGSGVFGDDPSRIFDEESISPCPTSTYAASKIAGEMLLSAYCNMFGLSGITYRFANVVGPNQTHGVGLDFIRKLKKDPSMLNVLGDGSQSKSYIYIDDVISGLMLFLDKPVSGYNFYNLSTEDYITVREIVALVVREMGLEKVRVVYGVDTKGWAGDVPVIRFSAKKIKRFGWENSYSSEEAMRAAILGMLRNFGTGDLGL